MYNCQLKGEISTLRPFILLLSRIFPIFRQKMYGLNPSEVEIEIVLPGPTYYLLVYLHRIKIFYF